MCRESGDLLCEFQSGASGRVLIPIVLSDVKQSISRESIKSSSHQCQSTRLMDGRVVVPTLTLYEINTISILISNSASSLFPRVSSESTVMTMMMTAITTAGHHARHGLFCRDTFNFIGRFHSLLLAHYLSSVQFSWQGFTSYHSIVVAGSNFIQRLHQDSR
jgi:hypothetical protein